LAFALRAHFCFFSSETLAGEAISFGALGSQFKFLRFTLGPQFGFLRCALFGQTLFLGSPGRGGFGFTLGSFCT
jgi:hypothetical protein